jgi:hypothetical protein
VATFPTRTTGTTAGRPPRTSGARPVSAWAFAGVAVTSFGGPLALAALYAPGIVAGSAGASAGLAMVAAVAVFAFPLAIWLRYARAPIPGMAVAERFAGHGFAVTVGVGVAVSVADRTLPAWVLTAAATAFAVYGLWATIQHSGS